jgi:hypothetical protein
VKVEMDASNVSSSRCLSLVSCGVRLNVGRAAEPLDGARGSAAQGLTRASDAGALRGSDTLSVRVSDTRALSRSERKSEPLSFSETV